MLPEDCSSYCLSKKFLLVADQDFQQLYLRISLPVYYKQYIRNIMVCRRHYCVAYLQGLFPHFIAAEQCQFSKIRIRWTIHTFPIFWTLSKLSAKLFLNNNNYPLTPFGTLSQILTHFSQLLRTTITFLGTAGKKCFWRN